MVGGGGIRRFFKDLFGLPDLFAQSKADRGRELLARCGAAAAAETVLIGDTVHDFEVARELGCRCVLMAGGHQSERRLKRCGCPVVAGMRELAAHVPDGGGGAGRQGAIHRGGRRRA
jgi:phosphoglycolate phosphatase